MKKGVLCHFSTSKWPIYFGLLGFIASPAWADINITIVNNLTNTGNPCAEHQGGNTVTVFLADGSQYKLLTNGGRFQTTGDYSKMPGLGIQVNNWYWTQGPLPVTAGPPQNPDNSGGQLTVSNDGQCTLVTGPAWFGKGVETSKIAKVTARPVADGCEIDIAALPPAQNNASYTNAVTPACCSPPLNKDWAVCGTANHGSWGQTNNQLPWPPQ
jgi:hypothetical protein